MSKIEFHLPFTRKIMFSITIQNILYTIGFIPRENKWLILFDKNNRIGDCYVTNNELITFLQEEKII